MKAFICHFTPGSASSLMLLVAMAFGVAPVAAQVPRCASLADVLGGLLAGYGEGVVWEGAVDNGQRLLVTAKPDGTTWTALIVQGDEACLVTSGTGWTGATQPTGEDI